MNFSRSFGFVIPTIVVSVQAYATDYLSEAQAQKVLFPAADKFKKLDISLTDEQIDKIKKLSGVRQRNKNPLIYRAELKGKLLGLFMIDEVIGKHEFITYALAISPEGVTQGLEIMSYRETHGGEIRNESWRKKLVGKKQTDAFKLDVDVPNISGATLSCRNVTDGVKRLLILQQIVGNG